MSDLSLLCESCHTEVHALANLLRDTISLWEATEEVIAEKRVRPDDMPDAKEIIEMRQRKSGADDQRRLIMKKKKKNRKKQKRKGGIQAWRAE